MTITGKLDRRASLKSHEQGVVGTAMSQINNKDKKFNMELIKINKEGDND